MRVDLGLAVLPGVAAHAAGVGGGARLVHLMTVEAAAQAGVVILLLRVAGRARPGIERGLGVRAVAVAAWLVRVGPDGGDMDALAPRGAPTRCPLGGLVTAHAVRRRDREVLAEPVAVATRGRRRPPERIGGVQRGADRRVTPAAQIRGRRREAALAVTVAACDAVPGDVGLVPGAVADVAPRERDMLGRRSLRACMLAATAACGRDHDEHQPRPHRNPPGLDPLA